MRDVVRIVIVALAASIAAAASCVRPDLTACGDVVCAANALCVAPGQCASADAVHACVDLVEGATCQADSGNGYCKNSACIANVCGDGEVTGNEVCDGSNVTLACADFGFYAGVPRCTTSCTIDRTACAGRCGDGTVDRDHGELCDGAPPIETCGDFGRDYGALGCNTLCTPNIAKDCHSYGWQRVLSRKVGLDEESVAMNRHGAVATYPSLIRVVWDGLESSRENTPGWTITDGDATTLVVGNATSLAYYNGTAWTERAFGFAGTGGNAILAGAMYQLDSDCSFRVVPLATGTAQQLAAAPQGGCRQLFVAGTELVALSGNSLIAWSGTAWRTVATGLAAGSTLLRGTPGAAWTLLGNRSVVRFDLSTGEARRLNVNYPQLVVPTGDGDVFSSFSSPGGTTSGIYINNIFTPIPFLPPFVYPHTGATSTDGRLIAYGAGVYVLDPYEHVAFGSIGYAEAFHPFHHAAGSGSGSGSSIGDGANALPIDDDEIAVCGPSLVGWFGGASLQQIVSVHAASTCHELIGDPRGRYAFADNAGIWVSDSGTYESTPAATSLAGSLDDLWGAAGYDAVVRHRVLGAWTDVALPAGCVFEMVAGGDPNPLYLAVMCPTVASVYRYDAPSWTRIADSPVGIATMAVAPDGTLYVSTDATARLEGNQLVPVGAATPRIVALSKTELYIDRETGFYDHIVNGRTVSVRMNSGPIAVTPHAYYTVAQSTREISVLPRMPVSLGGAGP